MKGFLFLFFQRVNFCFYIFSVNLLGSSNVKGLVYESNQLKRLNGFQVWQLDEVSEKYLLHLKCG